MMDLRTTYLGMPLPHPLVVGAGPLGDDLDTVRALEDGGAAMLVLRSLYEEEITGEQMDAFFSEESHADSFAEAELDGTPVPDTDTPTGQGPLEIAMSPDGASVYVTNFSGGTVSQYNVTTTGLSVGVALVIGSTNYCRCSSAHSVYAAAFVTRLCDLTSEVLATSSSACSYSPGVPQSPYGNSAASRNVMVSSRTTALIRTMGASSILTSIETQRAHCLSSRCARA
jgi:hypothetical protein